MQCSKCRRRLRFDPVDGLCGTCEAQQPYEPSGEEIAYWCKIFRARREAKPTYYDHMIERETNKKFTPPVRKRAFE